MEMYDDTLKLGQARPTNRQNLFNFAFHSARMKTSNSE